MRRAPVIPKNIVSPTTSNETNSSTTSAAPVVDSLIARVGAMARGNSITLPVCGRDVRFILEVISGDTVESASYIWSGNERDQELLTEDSLDDLIPSFLLTGQQNPAFGRRVDGLIEVADGSRRRKAAIEFWWVTLMMSRWRPCPVLAMIIVQQAHMNVVSVMHIG